MDRDADPREFEPNLEDDREVPLVEEGDGLELPPATLDPDERVELVDDEVLPLDDERPA
ncbi:hypothetical protein ACFFGH_30700 [Lysobacter korlensis]|uniref:Uncharacterized protein n=1 Tax=Lysobacter korlensis TaxID=553636 RepID=A0ABV6S295_9GAMM